MTNFINSFTNTHIGHIQDLPHLSEAVDSIEKICSDLNLDEATTYLIPKVQLNYIFEAIIETLHSIDMCAKAGHFSTVEALSRIAVEMSANARFLYYGDLRERSKCLVQHYVKSKESSTKKWLEFATHNESTDSIAAAQSVQATINEWKIHIPWINQTSSEKWPNTIRDKFVAIDEEEAYLTVFSSASDSVHSLSEDIFNQSIAATLSSNGAPSQIEAMQAEKASFAIYLYAYSATFFYNTISIFSEKFKLKTNDAEAERCRDILDRINTEHHSSCINFRNATLI